jgi:hypothetical protein
LPLLPLICVLAATLILGSISLIFPFGRDQGIHAFVADAMLHGKVLYRDAFDFKPPLTYFVHLLALLLFGHSMTTIRFLDLLWSLATAFTIFALVARTLRRPWTAALAGVLYPFHYYVLGYWHTAQTDGWLNLPLAAASLFTVLALDSESSPGRFRWRWLAVGAFVGLAFLFKYTAGIILPALIVLAAVRYRRRPKLARPAVVLQVAGFVLPLVFMLCYLLVSGALPAFLESQLRLVPAYARVGIEAGFFHRLVLMVANFAANPNFWVGGVLGLAGLVVSVITLARGRPEDRILPLLAIIWLGAALVSLLVQGRFFGYHYLPVLAPLAVLCGIALDPVIRRVRRAWQTAAVFCAVLFGLVVVSDYPRYFDVLYRIVSGSADIRDYWSAHTMGSSFALGEELDLADYLDQTTPPKAKVFIWGFEPLVNFVAQRGTVSRFIYNLPVAAAYAEPAAREELLSALRKDPPLVFIIAHRDETPWVMGHELDSYGTFLEFAGLRGFVEANYQPETQVGRFDVWRLKASR